MSGCPIDHSALAAQKKTETCPVDHGALSHEPSASSSSIWSRLFSSQPKSSTSAPQLSTERELSSIPKATDGNWVYPSEAQFFAAMDRKNHNPQAADMKTIVPIHNAVNERAWTEIMKWEAGRGGEACGGVKLVNFKGRPGDMSPKARWKSFLGCVSWIRRNRSNKFDRCLVAMQHRLTGTTGLWIVVGRAPGI